MDGDRVMECEKCNGKNFRLYKWAWGTSRGGLPVIKATLVCNKCKKKILREYGNESMLRGAFPGIDIYNAV